jgi:transmembrane sensor
MDEPRPKPELIELSALEQEAAEWVARLDAGWSEELEAEFKAWKSQSRHHQMAAQALQALWADLDVLAELRVEADGGARPPARRAPLRFSRGLAAAVVGSIAASIAAVAVVLHVSDRPPPPQAPAAVQPGQVYETALGKQRTVNLADGSSVQLNTNSRLEVRYSPGARDLRLVRGEAFFEVAHDAQRPFTVVAGSGVVQALGTAFAVRVGERDMHVTLTKGVVRLRRASPGEPTGAGAWRDVAVLTARPGQHAEALVTPEGIRREAVSSEFVARELSWRQGMLVFDDEPLADALADMRRYTDVEVELADAQVGRLKVSGYFETGDVEAMVEALHSGFGVEVERLGPKHLRLSAAAE